MNRVSWVILALCGIILASMAWVFITHSETQQPQDQTAVVKIDPLFEAVHSKDYATVKKLVKQNPGILQQFHSMGGTYMNCAASTKDVKMMELIIKLGGNPNGTSGCGMSPLIMAVNSQNVEMVRVLLEGGANPNTSGHASNLLTTAKHSKNQEMIKMLLKYGAKEPRNKSVGNSQSLPKANP